MRRGLALLATAFLSACAGSGGDERPPAREPSFPTFLSQRYSDGEVVLRYPRAWRRSTLDSLGTVFSDRESRHPAFVALAYRPRRDYTSAAEFARLAGRLVRPPDGRGLTLLYTQTARLGGRRGIEAAFVIATRSDTPLGPRASVYGIELASGQVAVFTFAAERLRLHAGTFGWIRKSIVWTGGGGFEPRRAGRVAPGS